MTKQLQQSFDDEAGLPERPVSSDMTNFPNDTDSSQAGPPEATVPVKESPSTSTSQCFRVGDIKPNPFRHSDRYPIQRHKVDALRESLRTTGFWDNVVARLDPNGKPELAYGHHRRVALKEEFGVEHQVALIIKPLDNDAMIKIMARENMEEWGSSATIEHETIKAVVQAYADGKIELPPPDPEASSQNLRYAPSFVPGRTSVGATDVKRYTALTVAKYLGWTVKGRDKTIEAAKKVTNALGALELIEQGLLTEKQFEGLKTTEAAELVTETRRIRDESRAAAKKAAEASKKAEREAKSAAVDRAKAAAAGKLEEAEAAGKRAVQAQAKATKQKTKANRAVRDGARLAADVGAKLSEGLQKGEVATKHVKYKAKDMEDASTAKAKKAKAPPPDIDLFAKNISGKLVKFLTEQSEDTKQIRALIKDRQHIEKGVRRALVTVLMRISRTAQELATALSA